MIEDKTYWELIDERLIKEASEVFVNVGYLSDNSEDVCKFADKYVASGNVTFTKLCEEKWEHLSSGQHIYEDDNVRIFIHVEPVFTLERLTKEM